MTAGIADSKDPEQGKYFVKKLENVEKYINMHKKALLEESRFTRLSLSNVQASPELLAKLLCAKPDDENLPTPKLLVHQLREFSFSGISTQHTTFDTKHLAAITSAFKRTALTMLSLKNARFVEADLSDYPVYLLPKDNYKHPSLQDKPQGCYLYEAEHELGNPTKRRIYAAVVHADGSAETINVDEDLSSFTIPVR